MVRTSASDHALALKLKVKYWASADKDRALSSKHICSILAEPGQTLGFRCLLFQNRTLLLHPE